MGSYCGRQRKKKQVIKVSDIERKKKTPTPLRIKLSDKPTQPARSPLQIKLSDKPTQPARSPLQIKLSDKPARSPLKPDINVKLFGDNNTIGDGNNFDLSNTLIQIGLNSKKTYKPKPNPIKGIKDIFKNARNTHLLNIKKMALIYSLVPVLNYGKQMKDLFNVITRNPYAFGPYILSLNKGKEKLSKPQIHNVYNYIQSIEPEKISISYEKVVMLRYRRHCQSKGSSGEWFSLQSMYGLWSSMSNLDIIAIECSLGFSDDCLLLTDAVGVVGGEILSIQYEEILDLANMYDYNEKSAKLIWKLVKVMKKIILFQTHPGLS